MPAAASCTCKVGSLAAEQREWVEQQLLARKPYRALEKEVEERYGVKVYAKSLLTHKQRHMDPEDDELTVIEADIRAKLLEELEHAPTFLKPAYLAILGNMGPDGSAQALISAIKLVNDITGAGGSRDTIADFAVARAERERAKQAAS